MATGKIIKRTVDALLAAGRSDFLWDDALKGFGVKILPSGRASYILQYRMGGAEEPTLHDRDAWFALGAYHRADAGR